MQNNDVFSLEYGRLNPQQKQAVDTLDGPVMVLAGPGTGKTQILSLRIANIVQSTDTPPDAILALTFTEAAAANMRIRLARMMGSLAYRVHIHTFHSFASSIISRFPEMFVGMMDSQLATEVDQIRTVEHILKNFRGTYIQWYDTRNVYVYALVTAFDQLKREHISPEMLRIAADAEMTEIQSSTDLYHEKGAHKGKIKSEYKDAIELVEKNRELADLYEMYLSEQKSRKQYDFTDMLIRVVESMERDPDFLLRLQEEYQYILVDEHQDSNRLQNRMITLLASFFDSPNLFVVGDEKQAIYRFQGASPEYFFGFKTKYPDAKIIHLSQNYRSHQGVLDLAHSVIPAQVPLVAQPTEIVHPTLSVFPDEATENFGVTVWIREFLSQGIDPTEIAVLVRKNSHGNAILRACQLAGIQANLEADTDVFSVPLVASIVHLMNVLYDPHNDESMARFLYASFCPLDPVHSARLIRSVSLKRKKSLIDIMSSEQLIKDADCDKPKPVLDLAKKILDLHKKAGSESLVSVFDRLVTDFCVIDPGVETLESDLQSLSVLFSSVQEYAANHSGCTFFEYVEYIHTLVDHGKSLRDNNRRAKSGNVRIMTAHRAKGLEFSAVLIPGVTASGWGGGKSSPIQILDRVLDADPDNDSVDDEKRLFYVAITRARSHLRLSYSQTANSGSLNVPSELLADLSGLRDLEAEPVVSAFADAGLSRVVPTSAVASDTRAQFHELIMGLLYSRPFAATHLNNYLADPWQYIFQNLIRVPKLQNSAMMYGSSVHAAIDALYKMKSVGSDITSELFLDIFAHDLYKRPISNVDYDRLIAKAQSSLPGWYESHHTMFDLYGQSEYRVSGVIIPECNLVLSGVLDRMEYIDGSDTHVCVIDFKTGKPKSRNDILGKTASSDGNYYRQLTFYKLLLDNFREGQYRMERGVLMFVEPKDKEGTKYVEESFVISEDEVSELADTIRRIEAEIVSGSYWDHIPDPKTCDYVELVRRIRGE